MSWLAWLVGAYLIVAGADAKHFDRRALIELITGVVLIVGALIASRWEGE